MNFLLVDSCQNELFVMYYTDGKYFIKTSNGNKKHNSVLLPAIDEVITEAGATIQDLQNIVCVVGPGSFTGIRLGVTTCNGIAFATKANRIAINTFESIAYNITNHILFALDCRHDNYYVGEYENGNQIQLANYTKAELSSFDGEVILWNGDRDIQKIIDCVLSKINGKEYVDMFIPLYLKKSQAERELEC